MSQNKHHKSSTNHQVDVQGQSTKTCHYTKLLPPSLHHQMVQFTSEGRWPSVPLVVPHSLVDSSFWLDLDPSIQCVFSSPLLSALLYLRLAGFHLRHEDILSNCFFSVHVKPQGGRAFSEYGPAQGRVQAAHYSENAFLPALYHA